MAWYGVVGAAFISAALTFVLISTYATDRYIRIVTTKCGAANPVNSLGSLSAMFADEPNPVFWRMGVLGALPQIVVASHIQYFGAPRPRSRWQLGSYVLGNLESLSLAVLTVSLFRATPQRAPARFRFTHPHVSGLRARRNAWGWHPLVPRPPQHKRKQAPPANNLAPCSRPQRASRFCGGTAPVGWLGWLLRSSVDRSWPPH
jgi:hypothetical protein